VMAVITMLTITGCSGTGPASMGPSPPPVPTPISATWTWISGSNSVDQKGIYAPQGTASSSSTPGARVQPVTWTDASGNFWMFGGYGSDSAGGSGDLNDLWEFSGGKWTWVNGSNLIEQPGSYGTQGTAAAGNVPGARYQAVSWRDANGNAWLFGGLGLDSTGSRGRLNDLWKYSGGQWTWVSGSNLAADFVPGVYGTQGTAAPGNIPGARVDACAWTDASGNLWLFGGLGYDSTGGLGVLNDLWEFSVGEWTWMSGSNLVNQVGTYGTQGMAASGNAPGARTNPVTWIDGAGSLWLFGGQGQDFNGKLCVQDGGGLPCDLNDLWKFSAGQWTWMGGSNVIAAPGVYGTQGFATPVNFPGARDSAVSWVDASGNFWLFGGFGFDSTATAPLVYGDLNDLWKYSNGQWTWVSGSNLAGQTGSYGMLGTSGPGNVPGARDSAVGWTDTAGNLWLFGGTNVFAVPGGGKFNDLWEAQP
jgi:N-acetylneuraminic acid mutarotase